uniref:Carcinustatin-4 n=1 Tax=Carcinus maenas TaxID=6759 RepID=ALL4_CARMA|nr:RecName: Full=Carcinustatin-4 [Carcinus maenas]
DPYAFGL